jgi:hypothetical protein
VDKDRLEALAKLQEVGLTPAGREIFIKVRDKMKGVVSDLETIKDKRAGDIEVIERSRSLIEFLDAVLLIEKVAVHE